MLAPHLLVDCHGYQQKQEHATHRSILALKFGAYIIFIKYLVLQAILSLDDRIYKNKTIRTKVIETIQVTSSDALYEVASVKFGHLSDRVILICLKRSISNHFMHYKRLRAKPFLM